MRGRGEDMLMTHDAKVRGMPKAAGGYHLVIILVGLTSLVMTADLAMI